VAVEIKSVKNPEPPDRKIRVGLPRFALLAEDLDKALAFLKTEGICPVE